VGLPTVMPYMRVYIQQLARQIGVPAPTLKQYLPRDFNDIELLPPTEAGDGDSE
jgi:hypothetical protein